MDPVDIAQEGGSMAGRPKRVFLSHTSELRQHPVDRSFVAAAEAAVTRAGHLTIDMEYFTARVGQPAAYSATMVCRSDVYSGIMGSRYGAGVADRPDGSYTELKLEAPREKGVP